MSKKKILQMLMFAGKNNFADLKNKIANLYPEATNETFFTDNSRATVDSFCIAFTNWLFADTSRVNKVGAISVKYDATAANATTNPEAQSMLREIPSNTGKPVADWVIQVGEMITGSTIGTMSQNTETKSANPIVIILIFAVVGLAIYLISKA
jgi:hypothetical protein